jgi:hypothetical protein
MEMCHPKARYGRRPQSWVTDLPRHFKNNKDIRDIENASRKAVEQKFEWLRRLICGEKDFLFSGWQL